MKNVANPANAMWPLRFTYRGAVVHITHKGSPLVKWGASVMSINIVPMHLRIEIEKQTRKADKIAALAAESGAGWVLGSRRPAPYSTIQTESKKCRTAALWR